MVDNDTDAAFHGGLGMQFYVTDRFGLRLEGQAHLPPAIIDSVLPTGDDASPDAVDFVAMGSLFSTLSEVVSTERQFYREKVVVTAPVAPPPPKDTDNDGLLDPDDRCPKNPEDVDGFEDEDGCPDTDNDKDGVADEVDKCPMQPELLNGIDDADGCPEEDTDGDGFLGSHDKCPGAPETINNFEDGDGCPDEIPEEVKKFTGVIEGIKFQSGSARILASSFPVLNKALDVLLEFKDVRLEIAGHTDSKGNALYNKDLSFERASSVRSYLVGRGVSPDRLVPVGYGEERPIASNRTRAGQRRKPSNRVHFAWRALGGLLASAHDLGERMTEDPLVELRRLVKGFRQHLTQQQHWGVVGAPEPDGAQGSRAER